MSFGITSLNMLNGFRIALIAAFAMPAVVSCADSAPYIENFDPDEVTTNLEADGTALDGESVALYGRFEEYLGGTLFVLEESDGGSVSSVLVVNSSDRSFAVPEDAGTPLWAVGEIAPLVPEQIDGVDATVLEPLEGEPALYAERITLAPEPTDLSGNAEPFYNQDVTIYGEVEQVGADNTFILEDPALFAGRGVIVIQTGDVAANEIPDDAKVAVSGILRPYVIADLEEDYDLTWDLELSKELEAEYSEVPVLIADLITPTNNY